VSTDLILRVAVESANDPELASALDHLMLLRGRRVISAILRQAEARGEIASDQDWSLVTDVTTAMSLLQVIRGLRVDAAFVRQVIDTLVMPAIRR
jgi:hypothetical protein